MIDALLTAGPWPLTLQRPADQPRTTRSVHDSEREIALAETLMGYARANPHRIRGRLRPVIVYDVATGREAFSVTMRKLRQ